MVIKHETRRKNPSHKPRRNSSRKLRRNSSRKLHRNSSRKLIRTQSGGVSWPWPFKQSSNSNASKVSNEFNSLLTFLKKIDNKSFAKLLEPANQESIIKKLEELPDTPSAITAKNYPSTLESSLKTPPPTTNSTGAEFKVSGPQMPNQNDHPPGREQRGLPIEN
jgi:hypothetical protein